MKIRVEERLKQFTAEIAKYENDFAYMLRMTASSLAAGYTHNTKDWLSKAIDTEKGTYKLFKKMKAFEGLLLGLTKKELRFFKEAGK